MNVLYTKVRTSSHTRSYTFSTDERHGVRYGTRYTAERGSATEKLIPKDVLLGTLIDFRAETLLARHELGVVVEVCR